MNDQDEIQAHTIKKKARAAGRAELRPSKLAGRSFLLDPSRLAESPAIIARLLAGLRDAWLQQGEARMKTTRY